jgi:hypothetical protein
MEETKTLIHLKQLEDKKASLSKDKEKINIELKHLKNEHFILKKEIIEVKFWLIAKLVKTKKTFYLYLVSICLSLIFFVLTPLFNPSFFIGLVF